MESRPRHFLGGNYDAQLDGVLEARVPRPSEAPERALAERIEEELELTQEAKERHKELRGQLEREVEAGQLVDLSQVDLDELPELELPVQIVAPDREQD